MAEDSTPSAPSASKSTGKTEESLTPDEALEIMTKAMQICEKAGIPTRVAPLYGDAGEQTVIILGKTRMTEKRLEYTGT